MKSLRILIVLVLCGLLTAAKASAQTLVLHHANGSATNVKLTEQTSITLSGGNIVVDNVTYAASDISHISYKPNALHVDINGDGAVDVGDIMAIINIMGGGSQTAAYTVCPNANHPHMIDLGLPSGTLWACCNVGANAPEDYGEYYAWGETQTKDTYSWDTYQYGKTGANLVNIGSDIAATDYDAATANWGTLWCMPSSDQCNELVDNCLSVWTTQNGVYGRKFTGTNGGTLFLPAAGFRLRGDLSRVGSYGNYWTSTLCERPQTSSMELGFDSEGEYTLPIYRCNGLSVRPVRQN